MTRIPGTTWPRAWRPARWTDEAEENFVALQLCGVCDSLRGPAGPGRTQHCRCAPDPAPGEDQTGRARYDIRKVAALCSRCGVEVLRSGSRWSPDFSRACQDRARAFNDEVGRLVIPIGAHSLMNRITVRGPDAVADTAGRP